MKPDRIEGQGRKKKTKEEEKKNRRREGKKKGDLCLYTEEKKNICSAE